MSDTLDRLRAAHTADITLPVSGITATIQLPRVRDCLVGGDIPLPVLAHLDAAVLDSEAPDLTSEQMKAVGLFNDTLVCAAVKALDGEAIDLTPSDLSVFEEEDLQEIVLYASRAKPLPGKD